MKNITTHTLKCGQIEMVVTSFGARVMKLFVPDKNGVASDVVLGYNTVEQYLDNSGERFLGAVCGRYANRIAKGEFSVDGTIYHLPINNNGQTLHGGLKGLDSVVWEVVEAHDSEILFRYISPDMEEGFPGELSIEMLYQLTEKNEFKITYSAHTTKTTPVNLTHHSFFNLKGEGRGSINDHIIMIAAQRYIPIDEFSIPLGVMEKVEGTPFDLRSPKRIGEDLELKDRQLEMGSGYDHCFVVDGSGVRLAAKVVEPESGRTMEVYTDQKGIQFYGGNFFDGVTVSKSGDSKYDHRGSFALETQDLPDAPNQQAFDFKMLEVGEEYKHTCIYKFSW